MGLTLPDFFGFFIEVRSLGEPNGDKRCANCGSNDEANRGPKKDLDGDGHVNVSEK
jgi:hypothetical protein